MCQATAEDLLQNPNCFIWTDLESLSVTCIERINKNFNELKHEVVQRRPMTKQDENHKHTKKDNNRPKNMTRTLGHGTWGRGITRRKQYERGYKINDMKIRIINKAKTNVTLSYTFPHMFIIPAARTQSESRQGRVHHWVHHCVRHRDHHTECTTWQPLI